MLLIDQDGKELYFHPKKQVLKLQEIGEQDAYGNTLCAIKLQTEGITVPVAIGVYTSTGFAKAVAQEILAASEKAKGYFQMSPSSVTALKLLRRIEISRV